MTKKGLPYWLIVALAAYTAPFISWVTFAATPNDKSSIILVTPPLDLAQQPTTNLVRGVNILASDTSNSDAALINPANLNATVVNPADSVVAIDNLPNSKVTPKNNIVLSNDDIKQSPNTQNTLSTQNIADAQNPTQSQQSPNTQATDNTNITTPSPQYKAGVFSQIKAGSNKVLDKVLGKNDQANAPEAKITVDVVGAPTALAKNIDAALSQIYVDDFVLYDDVLPQLKQITRKASQAVGYYQAQYQFEKLSSKRLRVTVIPNDPVKITQLNINVQGDAQNDTQFSQYLQNQPLKLNDVLNHLTYEQVKTNIETLASERGYFDGYWQTNQVDVVLPDNTADIELHFVSGKRYKFGDVLFESANNKPIQVEASRVKQLMTFKPDDYYDAKKITQLNNNLVETRWFTSVEVQPKLPTVQTVNVQTPNLASSQQSATFTAAIPSNQPVNLAILQNNSANVEVPAVHSQQNSASLSAASSNVLASSTVLTQSNTTYANTTQLNTQPVDDTQKAFTQDWLAQQIQPLNGLADNHTTQATNGLFNTDVALQQSIYIPDPVAQSAQIVPVDISLKTNEKNSAEVGAGYGTDSGARLRAQYHRILVNNLGHNMDANIELSQIRQALDFRYNMPYTHPIKDTLSLFGGYERELRQQTDHMLDLTAQTLTVGVQRSKKAKDIGGWERNWSLRYRLDSLENQFGDVSAVMNYPPSYPLKNGQVYQQAFLAGTGLNKVNALGGLDPYHGLRQYYQLDVGVKSILTDANLAILRLGYRGVQGFGSNYTHQVLGRIDLGGIFTNDFNHVPYNLRFFAGGDQSVRGYDYKTLSPTENNFLIGGQYLATGSVEYNYRFIPSWRGAVFVDAGNAYDEKFTTPTKFGAGFGLRWASPVGAVRVDLATTIGEADHPIRLYFYIGPTL